MASVIITKEKRMKLMELLKIFKRSKTINTNIHFAHNTLSIALGSKGMGYKQYYKSSTADITGKVTVIDKSFKIIYLFDINHFDQVYDTLQKNKNDLKKVLTTQEMGALKEWLNLGKKIRRIEQQTEKKRIKLKVKADYLERINEEKTQEIIEKDMKNFYHYLVAEAL